MAEAEYSTSSKLPVERIWNFVRDMDNWAAHVRGYRSHQKQSEDDSLWELKGDVGVLARTLRFHVRVTEWAGPERVSFELEGLNEPLRGSGSFVMQRYEEDLPVPARAAQRGLVARLLESIVRFFLRLTGGRAQRAESADAGPGKGMARLTFRLRLEPGGPMAPMVDAMVQPLMRPTAEELANKILADLERRQPRE